MKGSPILATLLACLIMLAMYLGMQAAFSDHKKPSTTNVPASSEKSTTHQTSVYLDIYLSNEAKNFTLSHPATDKILIHEDDLQSSEWSGEITLPLKTITNQEIELQCQVEWSTPPSSDSYQFIQVIISPSDLDAQSQTARAQGDISDILTFNWKENL